MLDEDLISLIAKNLLERGDLNSVLKLYSVNKAWSHGAFLAVKDFYKLETRQTIAFSEAILGHNVFITGGAGVGKSYTTKTITQVLRKSFGDDAVAVAAPTGAAATVVGGITLCRLINARKQPCDDLVLRCAITGRAAAGSSRTASHSAARGPLRRSARTAPRAPLHSCR